MAMMTSKERVLAAINHQEIDRIPIDLGGSACSLVDTAYFNLKDHLGIKGDIDPYRQKVSNVCYYDERILDHFDVDIRRLIAHQAPTMPKYNSDGTFSNEWGLVQRHSGMYVEIVKNPLAEATIDDIDSYNWPRAREVLMIDGMKERGKDLHDQNRHAISMRMPCNGIFEIACWLRGMENFMVDMMTDPEFAQALIDKILEKQIEFYSYMLDEVGDYVDIVESGDDYGSQSSLLISPDMYREFIFPARKKLNQSILEKAPQAKIFFHSCGAIFDIIEDLIDCGVNILNPIQTEATGMDPAKLKKEFGDRICFHGAIDTQKAMLGNLGDVQKEVESKINLLGQGGGYILAPCNHIQADVPAENIIAMFETAKKYKLK